MVSLQAEKLPDKPVDRVYQAVFLCARHATYLGGESPLWGRTIATANH